MIVSGTVTRRYYCSTAKEKGKAVCAGMKGIRQSEIEKRVLQGLREGLMQQSAYDQFRANFIGHLESSKAATVVDLRLKDKRIREFEKDRANLLRVIKDGAQMPALFAEFVQLDADLNALKAARLKAEPVKVDLLENLPELYRWYVDEVAAILADETVVGRAIDEIRGFVSEIIVRWNDASRSHDVEIDGKLLGMLNKANPAGEAGYVASESSLKLVAGTGFEPVTFRL
jgi:site-specific DNA recombinase